MGLGLTVWLPVGQGPETKRERYEQYFKDAASVIPNWNVSCFFDDGGFCVKLVPFEEDIYGTWKDGQLCISAKTNSAGPGYHAYVVDLIDGLCVKPVSVEDETGYYETRDFSALQSAMEGWLEHTSELLLKMDKNYSNISVSFSLDWTPHASGRFTCCPLGYFDRNFFERAKAGENVGSEFFVWWNQGQDALFFRNVALNTILCDVNWITPETDDERLAISSALECLKKAYALNPELEYPAAEWLELAGLSGDTALTETLKSRFGSVTEPALGYRRGEITSNVHGWRFSHSGKMHFIVEEDGSSTYWDDDVTIRLTTMTATLKEDVPDKSEVLLSYGVKNDPAFEPFKLRNEKIAAAISHKQIEEDGQVICCTTLIAALESNLLIMSLFYDDMEERDWAIKICASVARG